MFEETDRMNVLIETKGQFGLLDLSTRPSQTVDANRPCVVLNTNFIQARVALGQIRVHGYVSDQASDAEFVQYWRDSEDAKLAVSSFLGAFGTDQETTKEPAPKAKSKPTRSKAKPKIDETDV